MVCLIHHLCRETFHRCSCGSWPLPLSLFLYLSFSLHFIIFLFLPLSPSLSFFIFPLSLSLSLSVFLFLSLPTILWMSEMERFPGWDQGWPWVSPSDAPKVMRWQACRKRWPPATERRPGTLIREPFQRHPRWYPRCPRARANLADTDFPAANVTL